MTDDLEPRAAAIRAFNAQPVTRTPLDIIRKISLLYKTDADYLIYYHPAIDGSNVLNTRLPAVIEVRNLLSEILGFSVLSCRPSDNGVIMGILHDTRIDMQCGLSDDARIMEEKYRG